MLYLYFGALALFAYLAPLKIVVPTLLLLPLLAAVVRTAATAFTSARPTFGETVRAVAYAFLLFGFGALVVFAFSIGGDSLRSGALLVAVVFAGTFCASVPGFVLGLGTTIAHSALLALISGVVTSLLVAAFILLV